MSKGPREVETAFGRTQETIPPTFTRQEFVDSLNKVRTSGLLQEVSDRKGMLAWGKRNPRHADSKMDEGIREELEAIGLELDARSKEEKYVARMVLLFARVDASDTDPSDKDRKSIDKWYARQEA